MNESKRVYFDTMVLNKIAYIDNYSFIFERMKENGYILCISEVNIFEILRDQSDLYNIDKIITMLQQANKINNLVILPYVSEILVNYLLSDDLIYATHDDVIKDVINDETKEFKIDKNSIETLTYEFKLFCKKFKDEIKKFELTENCKNCEKKYCNLRIQFVSKLIALIWLDKDFCFFNNDIVKLFWEKNKIKNVYDLEKIIDENNRILNLNSPYMNYARMVVSQRKKVSNGVFLDGAHMCFLEYVDIMVSDDNEFKNLKNNYCLDEYLELLNIKLVY